MTVDYGAVKRQEDGLRLDCYLKKQGLSLRTARRMILLGNCLVNGKKSVPARKVKADDRIEILKNKIETEFPEPKKIREDQDCLFFYKPSGLHSAALAGKDSPSLESWLAQKKIRYWQILQRLDYATCGIITVAKNRQATENFRNSEKAGLVNKYYLCLLEGTLRHPQTAFCRLNTDNLKKTAIVPGFASRTRSTFFMPLACKPNSTWCVCRIFQGQRHQIRAHAASLGHPLAGDSLYGGTGDDFLLWNFLMQYQNRKILSPAPPFPGLPSLPLLLETVAKI